MPEPLEILSEAILSLLEKREPGRTICPSEAARLAYPATWRDQMSKTRQAARLLAERNLVEICQKGEIVDLETASGPVRIRKAFEQSGERP